MRLQLKPGGTDPPYLVLDLVGSDVALRRAQAREIVRAILERKYGGTCSPSYIAMVVASFKDDPVVRREPRYPRAEAAVPTVHRPGARKIAVVLSDAHQVHHVRERGYVESPVRIRSILSEIEPTGLFQRVPIQSFPLKHVEAVHDRDFVRYLRDASANVPDGESVYPYVFPIRNAHRKPDDLPLRAGYYCIDTFTPINANAYRAAVRAVDCALTAARRILDGESLAYALVRPPGHHAERRSFGGFCYFNSAAIAAHYLSGQGRVAVLDIDYHHGNGTQDIFYDRNDVLTVSIHGHPRFSYPYFSGYDDERGRGEGEGFNLNIPLPEHANGDVYRRALQRALGRITKFVADVSRRLARPGRRARRPDRLVVAECPRSAAEWAHGRCARLGDAGRAGRRLPHPHARRQRAKLLPGAVAGHERTRAHVDVAGAASAGLT